MNTVKNDEINRNNEEQSGRERRCHCHDKHGIFLTSRRLVWFASAFLLFCFFTFIAGYFFGKKFAVEKFYDKLEQDSFADHIYYSMCSMYDKGSVEHNNGGGTEASADTQDSAAGQAGESAPALQPRVQQNPTAQQYLETGKDKKKTENIKDAECKEKSRYYAELVGFGTRVAAQKFAEQLKKNNITVLVKSRHSKTAHGRVMTWYQVVSETFGDKNDLLAFVDDVSSRKRLKNVRIVTC
jgi:hypothetical protein